ncbi:HAD family hydrolase [Algoriphagus sediminis]|uniref:HAD family hydrolase n=1 Tax=Algoriphagus sediminis TaxID=3057113 RepID=A0ABT7YF19_9BACT|nr:HAD family hydrolase [Algoriphagus sediminis]MDN3204794.1 HAD family hydrolase [Algoriphagus sediminis]
MKAKELILALSVFLVLWSCTSNEEVSQTEPNRQEYLTSWNEGPAKQSIVDFVEAVTTEGSPEYVSPEDRIATFDNDGNLWSEQPFYFQLQFGLDQVKKMAGDHPEWMQDETLKAAAEGDLEKVLSAGEEGLLKIIGASHSGMTAEEFALSVNSWINSARHPKTGLLYKEMVYQPMLEVLEYLRAHDFKTFIVSGGGIDFMRPWTNEVYGIPPEQVVGSSLKAEFKEVDGKYVIMKVPELNFIDDKAGKPVGIHQHIGKRPIAAFGNSDGDLQMLQYSSGTNGRSFQMYIHHTDSVREWAYDRESHIGQLDKGLDEAKEKGWTVVDMSKDWKVIYPSEMK